MNFVLSRLINSLHDGLRTMNNQTNGCARVIVPNGIYVVVPFPSNTESRDNPFACDAVEVIII